MLCHYSKLFLPPWPSLLVMAASLCGLLVLLFSHFPTRISELYLILPDHHMEIQSPLNPVDYTWIPLLQPHFSPQSSLPYTFAWLLITHLFLHQSNHHHSYWKHYVASLHSFDKIKHISLVSLGCCSPFDATSCTQDWSHAK